MPAAHKDACTRPEVARAHTRRLDRRFAPSRPSRQRAHLDDARAALAHATAGPDLSPRGVQVDLGAWQPRLAAETNQGAQASARPRRPCGGAPLAHLVVQHDGPQLLAAGRRDLQLAGVLGHEHEVDHGLVADGRRVARRARRAHPPGRRRRRRPCARGRPGASRPRLEARRITSAPAHSLHCACCQGGKEQEMCKGLLSMTACSRKNDDLLC
jgi:hypothetical protein